MRPQPGGLPTAPDPVMHTARFRVPGNEAEAVAEQDRLRAVAEPAGPAPSPLRLIAGLDVAYAVDGSRVAGAVCVLDADTLEVVETGTALRAVEFPYVPGLFAYREIPALLDALARLEHTPDVLVCDGHGFAHPRRFGLASHLGVLTGTPAFGVAKSAFVGEYEEPAAERGAASDLVDGGEVIGRVLRTRRGVKPVFVSAGHRIGLDAATELTLRLTPRYRLPETTRQADQASRRALEAASAAASAVTSAAASAVTSAAASTVTSAIASAVVFEPRGPVT